MKDVKLAKNFSLSEFTKTDVTDYQLSLLKILAGELQKVRDFLQDFKSGKSAVSIGINSGLRTQADYDRLKKSGYNPSATSDHFCGLQLQGNPTIGAADISVKNCSLPLREIASKIIDLDMDGVVHFGQVIYETNPKTGSEWIHLGNDCKLIFQESVNISRKKYLMSLDNGKTYQTFKRK